MPTTIIIRLTPRQVKALRATLKGVTHLCTRSANLAGMIGIGQKELDLLAGMLQHIPSIGGNLENKKNEEA